MGLHLLCGLHGTGLGWFSAFVAACALVYAGLNFGRLDDPAFGVIWLYWAVLWALFFLVLGLEREELTRFTGAVAIVAGVLTCAVPAFLLLTGVWQDNRRTVAIVLAAVLLLSLGLYPALRGPGVPAGGEPAPGLREGGPAGGGAGTPTTRIRGDVPGAPPPRSADEPSSRRR